MPGAGGPEPRPDAGPDGPRPRGVRSAVVARPALQPLLFVALALLYVWVVQPTNDDRLRIPYLAIVILIPFASNLSHRDHLRELGLRLDNLWISAREVGALTLLAAALVIAIGLAAGAGPEFDQGVARAIWFYPFWGLAQQYAMQSFTYRRLREGLRNTHASAAAAATLFASLHYPNLALALVTMIGGYAWCRLFERHPNLFTLALSHGWLAVLLRYSWPAAWLHNLRIGPSFWSWTP